MSDSTQQPRTHRPGHEDADRASSALFAELEDVPAEPLWVLTAAVVVGDLLSTVHGLSIGLREQNPVVADVLANHGFAGLVALKVLVLGWAVVAWRALSRRYGVAALVGLVLPQATAVVVNLATILAVVA